ERAQGRPHCDVVPFARRGTGFRDTGRLHHRGGLVLPGAGVYREQSDLRIGLRELVFAPSWAAASWRHCNVLSFAGRELRDAVASRWFMLYTAAFGVLAVAVSFMSLAGSGSQGFAGFGRTAAGLLNLVMLVVPLMAITA